MSSPIPVTLVGATGLTGKSTLLSLFSSSIPFSITTFARRSIPLTTPTNPQIKWEQKERPDLFSVVNEKVGEKMGVFVSCLGTTIAQAGGMEKQKKIDLDLNRDLAKKAKEDGVSTYILVSSTGSDSSSWFHYTKMKGQLEDAVKEIGFDHCIILRPALLLGDR
ncbi:hypothetical protein M231_04707 [Tremella mesenterica]|uniref:NAD(P)-binding domain-containing protein n=2 Tax=Tremella mesenterica TaxID=5217 RepID=A0A4Q1BJW4_TREME|nr:hypothetical protein M231_04707 [Tremella mesenterica]